MILFYNEIKLRTEHTQNNTLIKIAIGSAGQFRKRYLKLIFCFLEVLPDSLPYLFQLLLDVHIVQ